MERNGQTVELQIPGIVVSGVNLRVADDPDRPGGKLLTLGPFALVLPISEEAAKTVVQGLTGIRIAATHEIPNL